MLSSGILRPDVGSREPYVGRMVANSGQDRPVLYEWSAEDLVSMWTFAEGRVQYVADPMIKKCEPGVLGWGRESPRAPSGLVVELVAELEVL